MMTVFKTLFVAAVALGTAGCVKPGAEPSRWEKAQRESTGAPVANESAETAAPSESDVSDTPPEWNPNGDPSTSKPAAGEPTGWKVGHKSTSHSEHASKRRPIDLAALRGGDPLPGSTFNRLFPPQEGAWDRVFQQEKEGFALVSLRRGGTEMASLSITDLRTNPSAAEKYLNPSAEIDGYPSAEIGSKGLGVLVGGRYQVQVRSVSPDFTAKNREEWIRRFNLDEIASLK